MTHAAGERKSPSGRERPSTHDPAGTQPEIQEPVGQDTKKKDNNPSNTLQVTEKALRQQQQHLQRSRFFASEFGTREPYNTSLEQFLRDSLVTVEIQTNIEQMDEYPQYLSDLSFALSGIFQRPESSMIVTVNTGCAIKFGIYVDEPSYLIVVSALPGVFGPVTNKRLAYLIQSQMVETFKIPPSRGLIRFQKNRAENLATEGTTISDEYEKCKTNASGYHSSARSNDRSSDEHSLTASFRQSLSRTMSKTRKMRRSHATNTTSASGNGDITSPRDHSHVRQGSSEGRSRQRGEIPALERPKSKLDEAECHGRNGEMTRQSTPLSGEEDMTDESSATASNKEVVKDERPQPEVKNMRQKAPKRRSWTRFFTWPGKKTSDCKKL